MNATAENLQSMMKSGDKDLINSIPLSSLKSSNFNISAIPPANLPDAFVNIRSILVYLLYIYNLILKVQDYARTQLKSKSLTSLVNDQDTLKRIVGGLRPSDMSSVSNLSKLDSAVNILTAASSSKSLSSVQVIFIVLKIDYEFI